MRHVSRALYGSLVVVYFVALSVFVLGGENSSQPFTYIRDVADISGAALSSPDAASRLKEDDKTHQFTGHPVLMNDRIIAVVQSDSPALEVYSRQVQGTKMCVRLEPMCDGRVDLKRTAVAIKENTQSTVAIEVAFRGADDRVRQITYELNAGEPFVKTTGSGGVQRLRVRAPCRFAVLPDFFGDDIVVDAAAIPVARAEIPSENFLLHMVAGGETIVMTVSESREDDIAVGVSAGLPRRIMYSDIAYGQKPHIWVAVLAEKGIWHERGIATADAGKVMKLDWQMPFTALWRVDWSKADKLTESWEMLLQDTSGKYVMQNWFGQREAEGQSFGQEFGDRDWNKPNRQRWNPVLGAFQFPCWIDKDGMAYLQPLQRPRERREGEYPTFTGPAIIYPIDRAQGASFTTPLEKLTVVDLVRMTLGVGPCQYILDLEGQKRNSQGVATCYARDVINAIYKEGSQLRQGPVIEQQLKLCVAFISNVRERIDQYVQFGREMSGYLQEQKRLHPGNAEFIDEMLSLTKKLDQMFEQNRERIRTPAFAQQHAEDFKANLLKYAGNDAYEKCAAQMAVFTSIGGAQDGLVAECRMIVKTMRQRAGMALAVNGELKEVAAAIRQRTQAMLRKATAYEAPRH